MRVLCFQVILAIVSSNAVARTVIVHGSRFGNLVNKLKGLAVRVGTSQVQPEPGVSPECVAVAPIPPPSLEVEAREGIDFQTKKSEHLTRFSAQIQEFLRSNTPQSGQKMLTKTVVLELFDNVGLFDKVSANIAEDINYRISIASGEAGMIVQLLFEMRRLNEDAVPVVMQLFKELATMKAQAANEAAWRNLKEGKAFKGKVDQILNANNNPDESILVKFLLPEDLYHSNGGKKSTLVAKTENAPFADERDTAVGGAPCNVLAVVPGMEVSADKYTEEEKRDANRELSNRTHLAKSVSNKTATNKRNKVHNASSKSSANNKKVRPQSTKPSSASNENANKKVPVAKREAFGVLGDITNTPNVITIGSALGTNQVTTTVTPVQKKKAHQQQKERTSKRTTPINSKNTEESLTGNESKASILPTPVEVTAAAPENVDVKQPSQTQKEQPVALKEQAAGVINGTCRGFLARKQAVTEMQRIGRGFLAKRIFAAKKEAAKTGKTEDAEKKPKGSNNSEDPKKTNGSKPQTSTPVVGNGKTPLKPPKTTPKTTPKPVSTPKTTPIKPKPTQKKDTADAHEDEKEDSSGCCWF